jgi:hypothetical protein
MTVKYKEISELKTVEILIDGKITEKAFDEISTKLETFIAKHNKIKIVEVIKDFSGADWGILGKGMKFDMGHIKNFTHCAVVSDSNWIGPYTKMISPFFDIEIKTFKLKEESEARNWLKSA